MLRPVPRYKNSRQSCAKACPTVHEQSKHPPLPAIGITLIVNSWAAASRAFHVNTVTTADRIVKCTGLNEAVKNKRCKGTVWCLPILIRTQEAQGSNLQPESYWKVVIFLSSQDNSETVPQIRPSSLPSTLIKADSSLPLDSTFIAH